MKSLRKSSKSYSTMTQYSWDAQAFGTALLWRTLRDTDSVRGESCSILCLGELQHETARALLFQNFEEPLTASEHIHIDENEDAPSSKGGFLLPEEIRRSQIITVRGLLTRRWEVADKRAAKQHKKLGKLEKKKKWYT
ncbi:hypothetical protein N7465_003887 [Penicillium sp. CMV-2018d]|nr:hypothetical protein N7465_003887 [Penicillium sp. CMV-2018d]